MATVMDVVQGISQAVANAYDGAHDERFSADGEARTAGLKREEGAPLIDKRVLDGFNVKFYGNMMCLSYQSEVQIHEVYTNGFEGEIEQRLADIAKFLKKEYKKITGDAVTLTKEGEADIRVEGTSRIRSWVTAKMHYTVGGLNKDMVEASWKKFLDLGGWKGKRPENDTRKKGSEVEKK